MWGLREAKGEVGGRRGRMPHHLARSQNRGSLSALSLMGGLSLGRQFLPSGDDSLGLMGLFGKRKLTPDGLSFRRTLKDQ